MNKKIESLENLMESLINEDRSVGLPEKHGEIDWTCLPNFGGVEPPHTEGIWSWDETRLLVGTCSDDLEIIRRQDLDW